MLNIAPTSINTTTKETTSFPLEQGWIEALQAHLNLSQISRENLMLKIVATSMNTATTAMMTEGTILFPLERGRIEALSLSLQAHTNLVQFSQEKLLLQLQSIILPRQQQKGQYCFQWNEEGLKLFKLILIFV
jgi:hypothetical protein